MPLDVACVAWKDVLSEYALENLSNCAFFSPRIRLWVNKVATIAVLIWCSLEQLGLCRWSGGLMLHATCWLQVLKAFHYPTNVTLAQFAVGSVLVIIMWTFNLYKRPKLSRSQVAIVAFWRTRVRSTYVSFGFLLPFHDPWQLLAILPLAVVHTLGNLFTNMSLGKVAVSFTHTIKAMEPFFSVILSAMFLGEVRILINLPLYFQI